MDENKSIRPWRLAPWHFVHHRYDSYVSTGLNDHNFVHIRHTDNPPSHAELIALAPEMAEAILNWDYVVYGGLAEAGVKVNKYGRALHDVANKLRTIIEKYNG